MNKSPYFSKSQSIANFELVCAASEEEFFYTDSDLPVSQGDPVGIDIDRGKEVELSLFNNIYWRQNDE
tara:strand:- start:119 stop:322 length:204 start_codon:yes stop_codon:yes gene_type:complete